jgi:hypothetical protein
MYITIDHASQFRDQFHRAGRGDQFSYEGLGLLFDYLEEIDSDYDLDVIALCCEYSEATTDEINASYDVEGGTLEWLEENTSVVGVTSTGLIVYQQF